MITHSELGASICKRWWNCPGSVRLSQGIPNISSDAANLGTAAHELAAICLESGQDAEEYTDRQVNGIMVDVEMAEAVQVYLEHCRSLPGEGVRMPEFRRVHPGCVMVEKQFDLVSLQPPAPMFGTADFVLYVPVWRKLFVCDYKHGVGVNVEAVDNPQLKYYALGAVVSLGPEQPVSEVEVAIIQPRAPGREPIKRAVYSADELAEWSIELMSRAAATQAPGASLQAGEWCKFCPAAGQCPSRAETALAVAQTEFGRAFEPPEIRLLTPEQIGGILAQAPALESWLTAVRAFAERHIQAGGEIPGWKLVATRGRAAWIDAEAATFDLQADHGMQPGEIMETPELRSPAQIRGVIAAKIQAENGGTKKAAELCARDILAPLLHSPSSGLKLAPVSDHRDPALVGGAEFAALAAP